MTNPCGVCGMTRWRVRTSVARGVHVYECGACALLVCDPLPGPGSPSSGAASIGTEEAFTARIVASPAGVLAAHRALARSRHAHYSALLDRRDLRIVEVGCGIAGGAEAYQEAGATYLGIDLDPRPLEAARRRGVADVLEGDFLEMDVGPCDVIIGSQVLEHITEPTRFVARAKDVLRSGGICHVDVPNDSSLMSRITRARPGQRHRYGAIEYPHHSLAYRPRTLRRLFDTWASFEVFGAVSDDPLWGQAVVASAFDRVYYAASRALRSPTLLVGVARVSG